MSGPDRLEVHNPTVRTVARQDLPSVASNLREQSIALGYLRTDDETQSGYGDAIVFGSVAPGAAPLGKQYNDMLNVLAEVCVVYAGSVGDAAESLDTIADNYQRTDSSLAGE